MKILPQVQEALAYIRSVNTKDIDNRLQYSRVFYERLNPMAGAPETVFSIENRGINLPHREIIIRIYRPSDHKALPAVVFFHGGGFFKGSLETHDRPLRQLANLSGVVIISVDYRLAPEYPFPHGLNDCVDATEWIMNHAHELGIDGRRIAVAGDSAGGSLAIGVAERVKGIVCQVLIYPATDPSLTTDSWTTFAKGPILTLQSALELWEYYTKGKDNAEPIYKDDLSGIPDTFIIVGEYDPLVDESMAYANKLRRANVQVTEKIYRGMIHGFFQFGAVIDDGKESIAAVARYIRYKLVE